jgi:putative oxidoreductase
MNYIQRVGHWGDVHHPKWIDILRMGLGAFLFYKGIDFIQNMSTLISVMSYRTPFGSFGVELLGHYVAYVHLIGGLLLFLGISVRMASLFQLPILIGAVIFMHSSEAVLRPYSELYLSWIVLALLVYFLIAGDGPWSFKVRNEDDGKPEHGI